MALPGTHAQSGSAPDTTFEEQNTGGHSVLVSSIELPENGFVAIHDASLLEGKVFESVIGISTHLPAGAHENVRVYLTRPLAEGGETLVAMPHKDTNGNHVYDFVSSNGAHDGPFKGGPDAIPESFFEQNAPALAGKGFGDISAVPRQVNTTAFLETRAQMNSGRSVTLDYVELSIAGYVAIHDSTLIEGAGPDGLNGDTVLSSVIGVSDLLQPGIHRDVLVLLNHNCTGCKTDGNMTGTLIPMAHKESGQNATRYDFVASGGQADGPFTGQPGTPLTAVINVVDVDYSDVATETFPDQATGGHIVLFPELFVPQGGYAAVHDETLLDGNVLGSVVGVSQHLAPGIHRNVTVVLDFDGANGIDRTQTLVGMLHRETNGNTAYDFVSSQGADDGPYAGGPDSLSEDQLPSGLQGQGLGGVNAVPAKATLSAAVRLAPQQALQDRSLRIDYADFSEAGFVALHDASLLADPEGAVFSSVVGVSEQLTGLHRDLRIAIPGANCAGCMGGGLNVSQLLIAMPHKDSDTDGRYSFITSSGASDGPFVTGDAASNTVSALDQNIVVGTGFATVPRASAASEPDAKEGRDMMPTPPTRDADSRSPAEENEPRREQPGFGVLALVAATGVALLMMRRR